MNNYGDLANIDKILATCLSFTQEWIIYKFGVIK